MGECGISEPNALFCKRIGMPENEKITFAATASSFDRGRL